MTTQIGLGFTSGVRVRALAHAGAMSGNHAKDRRNGRRLGYTWSKTMKKIPALAASFAAIALYAAPPSFAGEVNGRGDPIPATDVAASECAFSGLNDHPVNPPEGDFPGRVQSFGAFLKFLAEIL